MLILNAGGLQIRPSGQRGKIPVPTIRPQTFTSHLRQFADKKFLVKKALKDAIKFAASK